MLTIFNLFGRSPFALLQAHMEQVTRCVEEIPKLCEALLLEHYEEVEIIARKICDLEHGADLLKNEFRNHLPNTLFMPVDRGTLLEIIAIQDSLADTAQDFAVLIALKQHAMPKELEEDFRSFLLMNLEAFTIVSGIIHEMRELLESSFGGREAQKVRSMVDDVAFCEHKADVMQKQLLRKLIEVEETLSKSSFYLWIKTFAALGMLANGAEKLANRIRMTLEI